MSLLRSFINNHLPTVKKGEQFSKAILMYHSDDKIFVIGLGNNKGIITEQTKTEILKQHNNSNSKVYFFTLFDSKETFQKNSDSISWGSYVWLATEPTHTIHFDDKPKLNAKLSY